MTSVNQSPTFLPNVSPSSLGGNASAYQEKMNGGQGYGYEGKMITPGVAEVSSYKGGKRQSKRRQSKRRQSKRRQNKSRKQRK